MPNTPNKNKGNRQPPKRRAVGGGTDREEARHEEIISVHREIAKSSSAIKWATWVYAAAAIAMLLWSITMFVFG